MEELFQVLFAIMIIVSVISVVFSIYTRKNSKKTQVKLIEENEQKCEEIKKQWKDYAEDRYRAGKEDAIDVIRLTIDKVQGNKDEFIKMSEKDLLVEVMLALGSYSRRLDRIEEKIKIISNYNLYIESMNHEMKILAKNLDDQRKATEELEHFVNKFNSDSQKIYTTVSEVNEKLEDVGNIGNRTDTIILKLRESVKVLENVNTKVNEIAGKMNGFFDDYSEAPMVVLNSIKSLTKDSKTAIEEGTVLMRDVVNITTEGMDSIHLAIKKNSQDIDKVDDIVRDIHSDIVDLEDLENKICSRIDEILDKKLDEKLDDIDSMQSDISDICNLVNNSLDRYNFDSIYNKLEELEGKIDDIEN